MTYCWTAMLELGRALRTRGYAFSTVTPATQARVLANPLDGAITLRDIFGWNRPFSEADVDAELLQYMRQAGVLGAEAGKLRCTVRLSTLAGQYFFHSGFPTAEQDAVFFGPDTCRFLRAMQQSAHDRPQTVRRVVDIGCGSGAGAIALARRFPAAEIIAADINQRALDTACLNCRLAGADRIRVCHSDLLTQLDGEFDLIAANPPYLLDAGERTYRHAFGDQMMKSMAQRIRDAAEAHGGQAFRLDGANIAVLYPMDQKAPSFRAALAALQEYMRSPFSCQNHEVYSTLSLGAATFPKDGGDPATLLRNADAALQTARRNGGDLLVPYTVELNTAADQRLDMESDLRHALERGELELYYQPQQSLRDGSLSGFEALLRWRRNGEMVPPSVFIPLAEESGLIIALGDWVLEQACRQASEWTAHYGRSLTIAVNISPRQFAHPSFLPKIMDLLDSTHIDPSCLELEITEGVMMENTQKAITVLQRLRGLGLKLSIDDFGTGYSSLAALKSFPISRLKIDQSFVRDLVGNPDDQAITCAIISLSHQLDMRVIAEGVETEQQRSFLQQHGCDEMQGYLFSRPVPPQEITAMLLGEESGDEVTMLAP